MSPQLILYCFLGYTVLIFCVSWLTARRANNAGFFIGNKSSPWYVVAYGMIGASISGVTFISIPGYVGSTQFSYLMLAFGYLLGYFIIARVLLPLYYRLNLTSIYTYLDQRFGFWSYKTGAFFFLLSRIIGASFRMFLVVNVLQLFVFDKWDIPFVITTIIFISLIILYTFKGGIKTIIWTDTLQTTFMLLAVILSVVLISKELHVGFIDLFSKVYASDYSKMIFTDWHDKRFIVKQFLSGVFITIVMTGLDQEMMQKNLSCKTLKDSQKNMYWMSSLLIPVNLLFLTLGAVLYFYANTKGIAVPQTTDDLFPTIALNYLSPLAGIVFVIGLISAAYPSADGALTSLTTCVCYDFLSLNKKTHLSEKQRRNTRYIVHISVALVLLSVIIIFKAINNQAVIAKLFTIAGYTYGPLLGLYSFGLFTKLKPRDKWVPVVCLVSPVISYFLSLNSIALFNGYVFGFELLIVNGILTFTGLFILSKHNTLKEL